MKYLYYLLFVLSIGLFTSCGSDDSIEGLWIVQSVSFSDCIDPDDNGVQSGFNMIPCTEQSQVDCFYQAFDFLEDGMIQITILESFGNGLDDFSSSGTYSTTGDMISVCESGICQEGTYTLDGDSLVLTYNDILDCTIIVTTIKG